jgi:putative transposase
MSNRAYSEINLHFTWHVKASLPIITDVIEARLHKYKHYALQSKGVFVHEVGGTETHVHMAVSIPPPFVLANGSERSKVQVLTTLTTN